MTSEHTVTHLGKVFAFSLFCPFLVSMITNNISSIATTCTVDNHIFSYKYVLILL